MSTMPDRNLRPIPLALAIRTSTTKPELFKCSDPACKHQSPAWDLYVPDLPALYRMVRKTEVDAKYPLTKSDLVSQARCYADSFSESAKAYNTRQGITRMFLLSGTIEIMERWIAKNARNLQDQKERKAREEEEARQHQINSAQYRDDRKGVVNGTIASMAKPIEEKPNPKHRTHKHIVKDRNPNSPKRYGDERKFVSAQEDTGKRKKKSKNKDGDQKQKSR